LANATNREKYLTNKLRRQKTEEKTKKAQAELDAVAKVIAALKTDLADVTTALTEVAD